MVRGTGAGISAAFGKLGATVGSYFFSAPWHSFIAITSSAAGARTDAREGQRKAVFQTAACMRVLSAVQLQE